MAMHVRFNLLWLLAFAMVTTELLQGTSMATGMAMHVAFNLLWLLAFATFATEILQGTSMATGLFCLTSIEEKAPWLIYYCSPPMNPIAQIRQNRSYHGRRVGSCDPIVNANEEIEEPRLAEGHQRDCAESSCSANVEHGNSSHYSSIQGNLQVAQSERKRRPKRKRKVGPCAALNPDLVPSSPSILEPPTICDKCGAKMFQYEPKNFCCRDGAVKIATNTYPQELVRLFDSQDEDALHFRTYARLYNNLFAFSSLGGSIKCQKKKGIFVFSLHGQLYHFVPPLKLEDETPKYLQLYFYDALHERENRASFFDVLRPDVISVIMRVMEKNPYATFFRSLREKSIDEETTILINKSVSLDQRVYNAPSSDEVAAIWSDSVSNLESNSPFIVVTGKANESQRIMHYYGCYDPLQYPLLFPYGDSGWHQGIKRSGPHGSTHIRMRAPVLAAADAESLLLNEQPEAQTHIIFIKPLTLVTNN